MTGFFAHKREVLVKYTRAGGVPGGHEVIHNRGKNPFVPSMRECHSVVLRCSDVVVDIGAYCGTYALWAARYPVKRVVAFEPTASTFRVLEKNAGSLPNLEVRKAAVVGDGQKSVKLHISPGIGITNSIVGRSMQCEDVPAVRYEDAVAGASVVKIDVEGAEYGYDVVQESIRALVIDFHPVVGMDWMQAASVMIEKIEAAGFAPLISPTFADGWNRAGSWIRDVETSGCCELLLRGENCCGCGIRVRGNGKSLCPSCYELWTSKERKLFSLAKVIE